MPGASRSYCLQTPVKKMGFTQRASCKAQGLIARTSRKFKGRKVKSPKYSRKNHNFRKIKTSRNFQKKSRSN